MTITIRRGGPFLNRFFRACLEVATAPKRRPESKPARFSEQSPDSQSTAPFFEDRSLIRQSVIRSEEPPAIFPTTPGPFAPHEKSYQIAGFSRMGQLVEK